jgi:hypothetical protein
MNPEEERDFRNNQREIFNRLLDVEKLAAAQSEINNNLKESRKNLQEGLDQKIANLDRNLSGKIKGMTEIITGKLEQIHYETSKTNGTVIRNTANIAQLQANEVHIATLSKDVEYMKLFNEEQDIELGKLKDIIEPVKIAQKFPQIVKYTVIGFALIVIVSMWSMLGFTRQIKKEIQRQPTKNEVAKPETLDDKVDELKKYLGE